MSPTTSFTGSTCVSAQPPPTWKKITSARMPRRAAVDSGSADAPGGVERSSRTTDTYRIWCPVPAAPMASTLKSTSMLPAFSKTRVTGTLASLASGALSSMNMM